MEEEKDKVLFISDGINLLGPYSKSEILRMIYAETLTEEGQIYDAKLNQWFAVNEHPRFDSKDFEENNLVVFGLHSSNEALNRSSTTQTKKIPRPAKTKESIKVQVPKKNQPAGPGKTNALGTVFFDTTTLNVVQEGELEKWYFKDGSFRLGPYHFLTLLSLVRDQLIQLQTPVRRESQTEWKLLEEYITTREINALLDLACLKVPLDVPEELDRRKSERCYIDAFIAVKVEGQDPQTVLGFDLSEQGLAFVTDEAKFKLGQALSCTLISNKEEACDMKGKILRQEPVKGKKANLTLVKYALLFDQKIEISHFDPKNKTDEE